MVFIYGRRIRIPPFAVPSHLLYYELFNINLFYISTIWLILFQAGMKTALVSPNDLTKLSLFLQACQKILVRQLHQPRKRGADLRGDKRQTAELHKSRHRPRLSFGKQFLCSFRVMNISIYAATLFQLIGLKDFRYRCVFTFANTFLIWVSIV